jgi:glycosyltransferase involved in cell wall biosynthesis
MKTSLSVVTICFNNLADLVSTCASVDSQTVLPDEHLIIDGSTSEEILRWLQTEKQPPYRRWIHERDKGIADAFNKGVLNAKGTIIHLLNSGDRYFINEAIGETMKHFDSDLSLMWTHGLYVQNRGGIDVISGLPFDKAKLWKGMRTVAHPTMFIKKEVYDRHGLYNQEFKIAMDYDMLARMRDEKFRFIEKPLVYFAPGGASNTQFQKGLAEVKRSYETHVGRNSKLDLWQLRQKLLNSFMQTSLGRQWFKLKNRKKTL